MCFSLQFEKWVTNLKKKGAFTNSASLLAEREILDIWDIFFFFFGRDVVFKIKKKKPQTSFVELYKKCVLLCFICRSEEGEYVFSFNVLLLEE